MIATKQGSPLSRPVCAYPALPRYKGTGDTNAAASFECAAD
jgi:feruloyl esterase